MDDPLQLVIAHQLRVWKLKGPNWRVSGKPRKGYKIWVSATGRDLPSVIGECARRMAAYVPPQKIPVTDAMVRKYLR